MATRLIKLGQSTMQQWTDKITGERGYATRVAARMKTDYVTGAPGYANEEQLPPFKLGVYETMDEASKAIDEFREAAQNGDESLLQWYQDCKNKHKGFFPVPPRRSREWVYRSKEENNWDI